MKIWIDLRFVEKDHLYSLFASEIVRELSKNPDYNLTIYLWSDEYLAYFNYENVVVVDAKPGSIAENFKFCNQLRRQKFDLMIFFNEYKPIFYRKNYILIIPNLYKLLFGDFKDWISKWFYLQSFSRNLKNAKTIICFDRKTIDQINERFDIKEEKMQILKWFFPVKGISCSLDSYALNIRQKYHLQNDFLVYDSKWWNVKNLENVFQALRKIKQNWKRINLFILWREAGNTIDFRKAVLDFSVNDLVTFTWEISTREREAYYKQSKWIIFSNLYETFPFALNFAMVYNRPILANNLKSIRDIFWEKIDYFNILSSSTTYEAIYDFCNKPSKEIDYSDIILENNSTKYTERLIKIINSII